LSAITETSVVKIAVIGLNNAGKTTLLRTLQRKIKPGDNLAPTRYVERSQFELFGESGAIWDFGGQQQYRENYLSKPERHFADIRYMFFVIDIQESATFPDAVSYFKQVYDQTRALSSDLIISILFNKVDPNMARKIDVLTKIESLSKEIRNIAQDSEIGFYNTSVYDPISVTTAFSKPILGNQPLYNIISMKFADFAVAHDLNYMTLLVNDFELGSFKLKDQNEQFLSAVLEFYQQFRAEDPYRCYEYEGYAFKVLVGKVLDFHYQLYFAYRTESCGSGPSPDDITQLIAQIDEVFEKYPPKFA
jgi:GTPase SAR1 family protein